MTPPRRTGPESPGAPVAGTVEDRDAVSAPRRRSRRFAAALPFLCVLGVLLLVVWRTGPGKVLGVEEFERIARQWPTSPVRGDQAYVLRQALGQWLYSATGWSGTAPFLLLHIAALATAGLLLAGWLLHRLGGQQGSIAISLLLLSPLTAVLLEWIGMYDAFSMLVWVLLVIALRGNAWLQAGVAVLGGLQNFEQFLASVVLLALLPEAMRGLGMRARLVALVGGALAGKVVLELYLGSAGATSGSRATFLADAWVIEYFTRTFLVLAPVIVWTVLGALWIPVLLRLPAAWASSSRSLRIRVVVVVAIVLGIAFASGDRTRVMTLVTFPLLVLLCIRLAREETTVAGWLRRPEAWLLLLTPPFVIVSGATPLPLGLDLAGWGL